MFCLPQTSSLNLKQQNNSNCICLEAFYLESIALFSFQVLFSIIPILQLVVVAVVVVLHQIFYKRIIFGGFFFDQPKDTYFFLFCHNWIEYHLMFTKHFRFHIVDCKATLCFIPSFVLFSIIQELRLIINGSIIIMIIAFLVMCNLQILG